MTARIATLALLLVGGVALLVLALFVAGRASDPSPGRAASGLPERDGHVDRAPQREQAAASADAAADDSRTGRGLGRDPSEAQATPPANEDLSPEDRLFFETHGEPGPELLRQAFEQALSETFVDERLSSDEIEKASSALLRIREARIAMRALPMEPENARERRRLIEVMNEATRDFGDVMDMDPAAFTEAAQADAGGPGIDRDDPSEVGEVYVPDDDYLEGRRP